MKNLEEIESILLKHKSGLRERFKVKEIGIFGSYARNEQTEDSDVDILVEFEEPVGLLFVHLADFLEEILQCRVDLVTKDAIKPNRRKYIMEDLIYV
jgi:predicted nucleotidyltransferase